MTDYFANRGRRMTAQGLDPDDDDDWAKPDYELKQQRWNPHTRTYEDAN